MGQACRNGGLDTPVRYVKGVGEARAALLARLGISSVGDLLLTLPRRYEDRRRMRALADLRPGELAMACGEIRACGWVPVRFGKSYFEAVIADDSGLAHCRWYGARYLQDELKTGDRLIVFGRAARYRGRVVFQHPEFELAHADEEGDSLHVGRIVPVYPLTEHLSQRTLRRIIWNALEKYASLAEEALPAETRERWNLLGIREALQSVHFPEDLEQARRARERLVFEEFLCAQLVLVARKIQAERFLTGNVHDPPGELRRRLLASLPFALTAAQQRVIAEIREDMRKPRPMHRLLQGDVGSGKTLVAAFAVADAIEGGYQAAVMAPTEILAAQHAETFAQYLRPLGVRMVLLTSALSPKEHEEALAAIRAGEVQLVVGTHAVIQEKVVFRNLGLVVIDEQHKFGVAQRGLLYEKGVQPDVLVMTATPIPRTLAMTVYGDLDVSVLDEMPGGRAPVITRVLSEAQLPAAYAFVRRQVARGRQAYMVYPLVSESGHSELRAAETMFRRLKEEVFRQERLGLLHGQMSAQEKNRVMDAFRAGQIDILVATTVVEVGVDVPNANVMLVEHAERFGLAQLHQLRGRIGRGPHKSYCLLQGEPGTPEAWRRLQIMAETTDGFRIAEEDLRLRGMGNLLGREQSGFPALRVGDPLADGEVLLAARKEAFTILEKDPRLEDPQWALVREKARALYRQAGAYVKVG